MHMPNHLPDAPVRTTVCRPRDRTGWILAALLAGLFAVVSAAPGPLAPEAVAQICLNEILADPASDWDGDAAYDYRDDEWVEIVNVGGSALDLAGWRLSGADTTWRYEFSGLLGSDQTAVVYGSESYAWEQANGEPSYGLRLGNTGGEVLLWHLAAGDTVLIDRYTYGDHEAEDDRSTGRVPDGGDTWRVFDGLNPYTGEVEPLGTACDPSPGERLSCPTPVTPATWGRLKGLYR